MLKSNKYPVRTVILNFSRTKFGYIWLAFSQEGNIQPRVNFVPGMSQIYVSRALFTHNILKYQVVEDEEKSTNSVYQILFLLTHTANKICSKNENFCTYSKFLQFPQNLKQSAKESHSRDESNSPRF